MIVQAVVYECQFSPRFNPFHFCSYRPSAEHVISHYIFICLYYSSFSLMSEANKPLDCNDDNKTPYGTAMPQQK